MITCFDASLQSLSSNRAQGLQYSNIKIGITSFLKAFRLMWILADYISHRVLHYKCQGLTTWFRIANIPNPGFLDFKTITLSTLDLTVAWKVSWKITICPQKCIALGIRWISEHPASHCVYWVMLKPRCRMSRTDFAGGRVCKRQGSGYNRAPRLWWEPDFPRRN